MGDFTLKTDTATIKTAAGTISNYKDTLVGLVSQAQGFIDELRGYWKGTNADEYTKKIEEAKQDIKDVSLHYERYSRNLTDAATKYQTNIDEGKAFASGLKTGVIPTPR